MYCRQPRPCSGLAYQGAMGRNSKVSGGPVAMATPATCYQGDPSRGQRPIAPGSRLIRQSPAMLLECDLNSATAAIESCGIQYSTAIHQPH